MVISQVDTNENLNQDFTFKTQNPLLSRSFDSNIPSFNGSYIYIDLLKQAPLTFSIMLLVQTVVLCSTVLL